MPKRKAPSTLTGQAATIWESAYASAWDSYDPKTSKAASQEEYAAKVAWTAVKNKYKKVGDKWVKKSLLNGPNLCLRVVKAKLEQKTGLVRFHAQAANDELDKSSNEVLDPSLFDDLANTFQVIHQAYDQGISPPNYWFGAAQLPILDLSHYSTVLPEESRDKARLGVISNVYRDGRFLHVDGFFDISPMATLAAQSIMNDADGILRVSVGFWPDWGNIVIEDDILRFKGGRDQAVLDHLAVTSVPRIPTTTIFVEEGVAMSAATTMAEDAGAILGEDGADFVQELEDAVLPDLKAKSMVLLSEEDAPPEESSDEETEETTEETIEDSLVVGEEPVEESAEVAEEEVIEEVAEEEVTQELEEAEPVEEEEVVAEAEPVELSEAAQVTEALVDAAVVVAPAVGPVSFQDAVATIKAREEMWRIKDAWNVLQDVVINITDSPLITDKATAITAALAEYTAFIKSDEVLYSDVADVEVDETVETEVDDALAHESEEILDDTPEVAPVPAVEAEVAQMSNPAGGFPESSPASSVGTVDTGITPRKGRASTWGDAFDALMGPTAPDAPVVPTPPQLNTPEAQQQIRSAVATFTPEQQQALQVVINAEVTGALQPLLDEVASLRQTMLEALSAVNGGNTPQRPQRRSVAPVRPARVTTQAQTFSDVLNSLLEK